MRKFELLLNNKDMGGVTVTDSGDLISETNKLPQSWAECYCLDDLNELSDKITESVIGKPTYSIELEIEVDDENREKLDKIIKGVQSGS